MLHPVQLDALPGRIYYAFPNSQSLGGWETYRVLLDELPAPNAGRYVGELSDAFGRHWTVYEGHAQPSGTGAGQYTITLPLAGDSAGGGSSGQVESFEERAAAPASVTIDGVTIAERSVREMIDADRHQAAQVQRAPWGIRLGRVRPGSARGE